MKAAGENRPLFLWTITKALLALIDCSSFLLIAPSRQQPPGPVGHTKGPLGPACRAPRAKPAWALRIVPVQRVAFGVEGSQGSHDVGERHRRFRARRAAQGWSGLDRVGVRGPRGQYSLLFLFGEGRVGQHLGWMCK